VNPGKIVGLLEGDGEKMESLWNITIEDYLEDVRRTRLAGIQPGESMEKIFIKYMEEKGQKPFAHTELNKDELLADLTQKHGNILDISVDSQGHQIYRVIKPKDEESENS